MKEFFLFKVPEDFSLRDGDSLLDVFVAHAYPAIVLFTALGVLLWLLPGYGRIVITTYGSIDVTTYGSIDVTPANQLLSNPQLCFVGTAPSTGRPGWSNKGYPRGRHARALVKALADSLLGFWPRCPLSVGLSREHLFGLGSTWLGSAPNTWLRFWSACPPSVCPAPECL